MAHEGEKLSMPSRFEINNAPAIGNK